VGFGGVARREHWGFSQNIKAGGQEKQRKGNSKGNNQHTSIVGARASFTESLNIRENDLSRQGESKWEAKGKVTVSAMRLKASGKEIKHRGKKVGEDVI